MKDWNTSWLKWKRFGSRLRSSFTLNKLCNVLTILVMAGKPLLLPGLLIIRQQSSMICGNFFLCQLSSFPMSSLKSTQNLRIRSWKKISRLHLISLKPSKKSSTIYWEDIQLIRKLWQKTPMVFSKARWKVQGSQGKFSIFKIKLCLTNGNNYLIKGLKNQLYVVKRSDFGFGNIEKQEMSLS